MLIFYDHAIVTVTCPPGSGRILGNLTKYSRVRLRALVAHFECPQALATVVPDAVIWPLRDHTASWTLTMMGRPVLYWKEQRLANGAYKSRDRRGSLVHGPLKCMLSPTWELPE